MPFLLIYNGIKSQFQSVSFYIKACLYLVFTLTLEFLCSALIAQMEKLTLWGFFAYIFPDKLHIHKNEHNLKKYAYKYEVDFQKTQNIDILKLALFENYKNYKKENF